MEIWKEIKGYEQLYEVSNLGRIRTHENKTSYSKRHGNRKWKQRIMKYRGYNPKTGYRVSLWKNRKMKEFLVARLVAFTFFDKNIKNRKLTVNHKDGNRMNNNINNLELISLADNIRHAFNTGLMHTNVHVKLTNTETQEEFSFISMSRASEYMNKCVGYISQHYKKNKTNKFILNGYQIEIDDRRNKIKNNGK